MLRQNHFSGPANPIAAPQSFQRAGESHHFAAIFSVGRRIPSLRRNLLCGPANLIAMPQSFQWAGKFYCHTAIFSKGRRIPSPRHHLFSGPAHHNLFRGPENLIASPQSFLVGRQTQSFQRASAFHRQAAIYHLGRCIIVVLAVSQFNLKSRIIIELRQH